MVISHAKVLACTLFLAIMVVGNAYQINATFSSHDEVIRNPDRGFYEILWAVINPSALTTWPTDSNGRSIYVSIEEYNRLRHISSLGGKTLVAIYFDLGEGYSTYSAEPNNADDVTYLQNRMNAILDAAHELGLKVIVRIVGGNVEDGTFYDLTNTTYWLPSRLREVFKNKWYVLFNMEFGFGGRHGEIPERSTLDQQCNNNNALGNAWCPNNYGDFWRSADSVDWYKAGSLSAHDPYFPGDDWKCLKVGSRSLTAFLNTYGFYYTTGMDQFGKDYKNQYYADTSRENEPACEARSRLSLFDDCWLHDSSYVDDSSSPPVHLGFGQDVSMASFWGSYPGTTTFSTPWSENPITLAWETSASGAYQNIANNNYEPNWSSFSSGVTKGTYPSSAGRWTGTMGGRFCVGTTDLVEGDAPMLTCDNIEARAEYFEMTYFKYEEEFEKYASTHTVANDATARKDKAISSMEYLRNLTDCFDTFQNKLGYRYTLVNATLTTNRSISDQMIHPGHAVTVEMAMRNEGYAHKIYDSLLTLEMRGTLIPHCAIFGLGLQSTSSALGTANLYSNVAFADDCAAEAVKDNKWAWTWEMDTQKCYTYDQPSSPSLESLYTHIANRWTNSPEWELQDTSATGYATCEVGSIEVDGNNADWANVAEINMDSVYNSGSSLPGTSLPSVTMKYTNDDKFVYFLLRTPCTDLDYPDGSCGRWTQGGTDSGDELHKFGRGQSTVPAANDIPTTKYLYLDLDGNASTGQASPENGGWDLRIKDDTSSEYRRGSSLQMGASQTNTGNDVPNTGLIAEKWDDNQWVATPVAIKWIPFLDGTNDHAGFDEIAIPRELFTSLERKAAWGLDFEGGGSSAAYDHAFEIQVTNWERLSAGQILAVNVPFQDYTWGNWDEDASTTNTFEFDLGAMRAARNDDMRYLLPGKDYRMRTSFIMPFLRDSLNMSAIKWSIGVRLTDDTYSAPPSGWADLTNAEWAQLAWQNSIRFATINSDGEDIWDPASRLNTIFEDLIVGRVNDTCEAVNASSIGKTQRNVCPWLQNLLDDGTCVRDPGCLTVYCPGHASFDTLSTPCNPTCDDGETNGDETDVDCGGSCSSCFLFVA